MPKSIVESYQVTLYTCEVAQSEVGLLATRRRFSRHDRLRNACTQRVVQFEVADFTGAPLGGRFSVYGWGKKNTRSPSHSGDSQSYQRRRAEHM